MLKDFPKLRLSVVKVSKTVLRNIRKLINITDQHPTSYLQHAISYLQSYVLYQRKPRVTFLGVEIPNYFECITKVLKRTGLENFTDRSVRMNVDGTSVNLGKLEGLRRTWNPLLKLYCY